METTQNLIDQMRDALVERMARQHNAIIAKAISLATGAPEDLNPYDYLNRMAKRVVGEGDVITLDGENILWLAPAKFERVERRTSFEFHVESATMAYRFLGLAAHGNELEAQR